MAVRVDMSQLPAPDVVEQLDYEVILQQMLGDLRSRDSAFSALTEAEPAYKILEVAAFRELVIRQRVNDAGRAVMLPYATGADLENIGALFDVERLVVVLGDPDAVPPVSPVMEDDEAYRYRIQLSNRAKNTAGSEDDYEFWALSADGQVKDVGVSSPAPVQVVVSVLSHEGNGAASAELVAAVDAALSAKEARPLSDQVTVQSATINEFTVGAELLIQSGPDPETVRQAAESALLKMLGEAHRIGQDVALSSIYAALHQPGVYKVNLTAPVADIDNDETSAAYATSVSVVIGSG